MAYPSQVCRDQAMKRLFVALELPTKVQNVVKLMGSGIAGVKSAPNLLTLRDCMENVIADIGIVPDNRKFVPYVTLAYRRGLSHYDVMIYVSQHNLFGTKTSKTNRFASFNSHVKRGKPHHTDENSYNSGLTDP